MNDKSAQRAQKQRHRLLQSAKACFSERGLAHTTMRDIAESADMSLGNIYRYFKNKEALIEAFIAADTQELDAAFAMLDNARNVKKALQDIGAEIISEMTDRAEMTLYIDVLAEALRDEKIRRIAALDSGETALRNSLEKAQQEQRITLPLAADITALAIISFMENTAIKCLTDDNYSVRTARKQFRLLVETLIN